MTFKVPQRAFSTSKFLLNLKDTYRSPKRLGVTELLPLPGNLAQAFPVIPIDGSMLYIRAIYSTKLKICSQVVADMNSLTNDKDLQAVGNIEYAPLE